MKPYETQESLEQAILKDMQSAVDRTIIRLLEELRRQIQTVIYDAGEPQQYERTMEFLNMWIGKPSIITGKMVVGELSPDYSTLTTNRAKKQHIITGEALVNMLIKGYGNQEMWYNQSRDFYDEFEDYVDRNIDRIFTEEMNKSSGTNNITLGVTT